VRNVEKNQDIIQAQEDPQLDIEFVGTLEDVTAGWTGSTDDTWDGDETP